jgi:hypothetical protein
MLLRLFAGACFRDDRGTRVPRPRSAPRRAGVRPRALNPPGHGDAVPDAEPALRAEPVPYDLLLFLLLPTTYDL